MSDSIPRILITVEGGTVQAVIADSAVEYLLVDWDDREHEDCYVPAHAEAEIHISLIDRTFALASAGEFPFPEMSVGTLNARSHRR